MIFAFVVTDFEDIGRDGDRPTAGLGWVDLFTRKKSNDTSRYHVYFNETPKYL